VVFSTGSKPINAADPADAAEPSTPPSVDARCPTVPTSDSSPAPVVYESRVSPWKNPPTPWPRPPRELEKSETITCDDFSAEDIPGRIPDANAPTPLVTAVMSGSALTKSCLSSGVNCLTVPSMPVSA